MRFKSTYNIFTDFGEVFDPNWMNFDYIQTPPKRDWDYSRELQIEDVDVWEVIWEASGSWGLYASWSPYAEFYLLNAGGNVETFYGAGCQEKIIFRLKELNIKVPIHKIWIEPENMWLYKNEKNINL